MTLALPSQPKNALVVSGGGARAAYEAGVLKAIRELLPDPRHNPFPLLCGVSGGAINATSVAVAADDFGAAVDKLEAFWSGMSASDVYRADPLGVAVSGGRWMAALSLGWLLGVGPKALFDNSPLYDLLASHLDFSRLEGSIASHAIHALSITCSGYTSGQCVSFFQGRADLEPWQRAQWGGAHVKLGVDHIVASMGVPFLFPAVKLHREYFGDGVMRELVPLSPAIRLGADRILVISTGRMAVPEGERLPSHHYPSLAETAGHVLSGLYIDSLSADIERMTQVNRLVSLVPKETRDEAGIRWRPIELLVIEPSERLDFLAARHIDQLPWATRMLLRGVGATRNGGGAFASYLLFEATYTRALIDLGYRDAMARSGEIAAFLGVDPT